MHVAGVRVSKWHWGPHAETQSPSASSQLPSCAVFCCLAQGLKFDLIVYSPYKAIEGFLQDIQEAAAAAEAAAGGGTSDDMAGAAEAEAAAGLDPGLAAAARSEEQLGRARAAANSAADALMLGDAPLLHSPGRLALAAMRSGFSKVSGLRGGAWGWC